jgi:hypothetical protein
MSRQMVRNFSYGEPRRAAPTKNQKTGAVSEKLRRFWEDEARLQKFGASESPMATVATVVIPCHVEGFEMGAFVDTGSTISVISERLATILEFQCPHRERSNVVAEALGKGNREINFEHSMDLELDRIGMSGRLECRAHPGMSCDLPLGGNGLRATKACIDYGSRSVSSGGHQVPFATRRDLPRYAVRTEDQLEEAAKPE